MAYVVNATVSDNVLNGLRKSMRFSDDEVKNNEEALILFGISLANEDGFNFSDTEVSNVSISHWDDNAVKSELGYFPRSARALPGDFDD